MTTTSFDIVIPVGPNDYHQLNTMLSYTKLNIVGYRKIFVVSSKEFIHNRKDEEGRSPDTSQLIAMEQSSETKHIPIENVTFIDEGSFPFTFENIQTYLGKNDRNGWYFQQLIKLYSGFVIPEILDNYLVIDCDTMFLKPTTFFENGLPLYNVGHEYCVTYFHHMIKLHPSLFKKSSHSGICHHMMFQKPKLQVLFTLVENHHSQKVFFECFLECINPTNFGGASEYEIYFNFLLIYFENDIKIRTLKWKNSKTIPMNDNFHYVSCHHYLS